MNSNGKIWRIVAISVVVILAALTAVYGYGRLNGRFEAVEGKVAKAEDTRERVIRVEEGVEYLKKAVDRIERKMDE